MKDNKIIRLITIIIFYICFFLSFDFSNASQKIKIVVKIDNSIITSEDINNESNYLIALNENLSKLKKEEIYVIAKDSLIKEKIKKNEINKYIDIQTLKNEKLISDIIENIYKRLGFSDTLDFEIYLNKFKLSPDDVKRKLNIEMVWNQLIAEKFKNRVYVDENKIREKIKKEKINFQNLIEYDLSEIIFSAKNTDELKSKTNEIKKSISTTSFETAANKFSISDTANFGGSIGKVNENQLSKKIKDELKKIDINQFTEPISVGNSFLIIKINKKNFVNIELDENEIVKRMIDIEKKRQYENFSLIYYNKIKLNSQINEI